MKKIRFGIIGLGNQGSTYVLKLFDEGKIENGCVSAMCDINPAKIERIKSKTTNSSARYFIDYKEMLDSGLCDAVLVETPHYLHPEMAEECLKRNIHVICEKPAGVYTAQVKEMNAAAEKSEAKFAVMFNQRTDCVYRKMREIIAEGGIGRLQRVTWIITDWYRSQFYYDTGSWRATWAGEGGGVLINQCPHQLDLIGWVVGQMPKKVRGFCHYGKWHDIEVEDDVTAYVEYASGATGTFITTTGDVPGTNRFEITLEKGKLVSEGGKLLKWELEMSEPEWSRINQAPFGTPRNTFTEVETDGKSEQHAGVLNAFAGAILHGTPLVAGGEEGINGLTISNAMHLSAWLGREVELPLDEELYYQELMKRVAVSRRKTNAVSVLADTAGTYNA